MINYINNSLFKRGCAFPSWTPLVFFLKIFMQIISKISADLISSNYFGNKSEFRPRFKGTDYIRAEFTFNFFMKKTQIDFQTKNVRKNIRYHSSRTMITCKQAGGYYVTLDMLSAPTCIEHIHSLHLIK